LATALCNPAPSTSSSSLERSNSAGLPSLEPRRTQLSPVQEWPTGGSRL
jgi:hypothetical protein